MHHVRSAPRFAPRPPNRALFSFRNRQIRLSGILAAAALLVVLLAGPQAQAQRSYDLGFTYNQELTRFVGNHPGADFSLRGATIDFSATLWKGLGISANGTGLASTNLRGFEDIEHIQFMVGPRYTLNSGHNTDFAWNRHGSLFVEGKVGYTDATSGIYPVNGVNQDHATSLTYAAGGGINIKVYHRLDLRLFEADYIRTKLPNGSTDLQNTFRVASGINFHFGQ